MSIEQDNKAIVGRWFTSFWGKTCDLSIDALQWNDGIASQGRKDRRRGRAGRWRESAAAAWPHYQRLSRRKGRPPASAGGGFAIAALTQYSRGTPRLSPPNTG